MEMQLNFFKLQINKLDKLVEDARHQYNVANTKEFQETLRMMHIIVDGMGDEIESARLSE